MFRCFQNQILFKSTLFFWIILLSGCSQKNQTQTHFFDAILGGSDYIDTFDRWTKTQRAQSDFDLSLLAHVTFWNTELRRAYVEERSRAFRLSEEESKALAFEEGTEDERYFVFILTAATRNPNWNDFQSSKSIWRLSLESTDSRLRVRPLKVEKIPYKDETAAYFYRKMGRFSETFKVYFPKREFENFSELRFVIAGPHGNLMFPFTRPPKTFAQRMEP